MKISLVDILACPTCLGDLTVIGLPENGDLCNGKLECPRCRMTFDVIDGICIFGIRNQDKQRKVQEMDGENNWVCAANDLQAHLTYAQKSAEQSAATLRDLVGRIGDRAPHQMQVLDIGAGWGALQSWQFASAGFNVVATEISPEFLFAADKVVTDKYFERVVADATVLPFKNNAFDIVYCKELIHHLPDPTDILRELWRVSSAGALIAIQEPCSSVLVSNAALRKQDPAVKVGITHYYYSYREYKTQINCVCDRTEVDAVKFIHLDPRHHPLLARLQRIAWRLGSAFNEGLTFKAFLMLFGGEVRISAIRSKRYGGKGTMRDRSIIAIDTDRLRRNKEQLAFYRERLVPAVLNVFRDQRRSVPTL